MRRVFCGECKYLVETSGGYGCGFPSNLTISRNAVREWTLAGDYFEINKNNDCKDFKQKFGLKWLVEKWKNNGEAGA